MRIAQITFHNAQNCGAMLQAWALQQYLIRIGHDPFLLDCPENTIGTYKGHFRKFEQPHGSLPQRLKYCIWYLLDGLFAIGSDDLKNFRFKRFRSKNLVCRKDHPRKLRHTTDVAIFGSDQIWNHSICENSFQYFLGKSIDIPKIGYGISLGDTRLRQLDEAQIKSSAEQFSVISFREDRGLQIRDKHGREPSIVADPTLLASREDYLRIANPKRYKGKYLLIFDLMNVRSMESLGIEIASQLNLQYITINMTHHGLWRKQANTVLAVSPDYLLAYIRDAQYVLTDSFHGTVLSTIFGKPFLSYSQKTVLPTNRITTFLNTIGESQRICLHSTTTDDAIKVLTSPLSQQTQRKLSDLGNQSKKWLSTALSEIIKSNKRY